MRRSSNVAVLIAVAVLAAVPQARPAAAQGGPEGYYIPAPAFGGAPMTTPYTVAPALLNREDVKRALVLSYPEALKDRGEGGEVRVWILIDEGGDVMSARVRGPSGKPALDAAALRVTSAMRFSPGLKDGLPVKVWIALPVIFRVEAPSPPPPADVVQDWERRNPRAPRVPIVRTNPLEPTSAPTLLNQRYVWTRLAQSFDSTFHGSGARGTTTLRLRVSIAGDAATAEIAHSSGNPALDSLALSFKDRLVFVPAIRSGHYAEGTAELQLRFPPKVAK